MIGRRGTPAQATESLVQAHEQKVNSRRLRDQLGGYEGTRRQVVEVTGEEPITEDNEDN